MYLSKIKGVGYQTFQKITKLASSLEIIFNDPQLINTQSNIPEGLIPEIRNALKAYSSNKEKETLERMGIKLLVYKEEGYPQRLAEIKDPPIILYYKGSLSAIHDYSPLAIVGTRKATIYGIRTLRSIILELVNNKIATVSGMAYGIDSIVHRETIKYGGKTVAVLASSVDSPTPAGNGYIYKEILENGGLILSEHYPGAVIAAGSFPRRNRIIAGLSLGTFVVEAGIKSGALVTAHIAFDENRLVFALPGNIGQPFSEGTNKLIQNNIAKLVCNANDMIVELTTDYSFKQITMESKHKEYEGLPKRILDLLIYEPLVPDEIKLKLGEQLSEVLYSLTTLELEGIIARDENGRFFLDPT